LNRTLKLTLTAEQKKAQQQAEQVRAFQEKNKNPRDAIKGNEKSTPPLSDTEKRQLEKVDSKLAEQAKQFDNYSSVVDEARRTHRSTEDVCKAHEKTDAGFETRFNANQKAVVDQMMQASYVTDRIPNYAKLPSDKQRLAVEAYVAANPRVREQYVSEMSKVAREALNLSEDPTNAATNAQTERAKQLDTDRDIEEKKLNGKLHRAKDLIDDEVKALFDGGKTVEQAEMALLDKTLEDSGIKPADYASYQEQQRMQALENEFQEAHKKGPHGSSQFDRDGYINGNPGDPKVVEYKRLQARKPTHPVNFSPEDQQKIKVAEDAVLGEVKYVRGAPVTTGGVRQELQRIHDNLETQQKEVGRKINVSPEAQAKADAEKETLKLRMEKAMEDAVEQAFLKDYDELDEINQRKIAAEAQDAGELGELREKKAITDLNARQKEHGVKTGTDGPEKGKKIINRTDIGDDARRIAQDGEEGVRRIELRNLSEGTDPVISLRNPDGSVKYYVDANGKPCDAKATGAKEADWRTVNYEQLTKEDRDLLDKIHESQGQRIAESVMVDYFFAQKPPMKGRDLIIIGDKKALDLSVAQQADLARYIGGDQIREYFKQSREFSSFKDILGEIQKSPGGEHNRFIMFLLLLLVTILFNPPTSSISVI